MTPWLRRCPQGHASIEPRQDGTYRCGTCEAKYRVGPFDARETEFPVDDIEPIETPSAADVLAALEAATHSRPSAAARQLSTPLKTTAQRLIGLRDRGLVEAVDVTGQAARWRLTAAGRREVDGQVDPNAGCELATDGGEDVDAMTDNETTAEGERYDLDVGTVIRKGDTEYQLVDDETLGVVATEIGDRTIAPELAPNEGDDCIRPDCDGHAKDVNGRLWCSEGCLEWYRATPQDGDLCDKYGDRCDGVMRSVGDLKWECDECGCVHWSRNVEWREARLPHAEWPNDDGTEVVTDGGLNNPETDSTGYLWTGVDCPEDDCEGDLEQQDEFNVMCLSCEEIWSHIAFPTEHQLQTKTGETVAQKDRRVATDGGQPAGSEVEHQPHSSADFDDMDYVDERGIRIFDRHWTCPNCGDDGEMMFRPGSKNTCATCFWVLNGRNNEHVLDDWNLKYRQAQRLLASHSDKWHGTPGSVATRLRQHFESSHEAVRAFESLLGEDEQVSTEQSTATLGDFA